MPGREHPLPKCDAHFIDQQICPSVRLLLRRIIACGGWSVFMMLNEAIIGYKSQLACVVFVILYLPVESRVL